MNKKEFKVFLDAEKESQWLNKMAAAGWAFSGRSFFTYEFKPCSPEEFQFQIEFVGSFNDSRKKQEYLSFLREMEIEQIYHSLGWSYFRRNSSNKEFIIFTDNESIMKHYKRIACFYGVILLVNLSILLRSLEAGTGPYIFNVSIPVVSNAICGIAVIIGIKTYLMKIRRQRKASQIEQ